jgi:thiosulfate dehydrogenase (quinone) large subunit
MKPDGVRPPVAMFHPARWIAVLRIAIGLYFVKALWTKLDLVLLGGIVPFVHVERRWLDVMPEIVARQAAGNPLPWYKVFLEQAVLTHSEMFASLTAWGEALVGISLVLGLLSGLGALGGLLLSANYGLASQHLSPASFGFHYVLVVVMALLFLARSGRALGLDAWITRRCPASWLARRPVS